MRRCCHREVPSGGSLSAHTGNHSVIRTREDSALTTVPLTRKVTKLARRSRDTRERLARDCLNVIAREGSRALESLISVLARQYNSRVVPRGLSSFAREGAISICMPVSYYPACGYPR